MRCLLSTGSKDDDMFSLSLDVCEPPNESLENAGVVGVRGKSSDWSETDVVELVGVLTADGGERIGVTGKGDGVGRTYRPPCR